MSADADLPAAYGDFFEDLIIGTRIDLGAHTFTRAEMIDFASRFDPQPFHLDDEAAAASDLGLIAASGWMTAVVWMRLYVRHRDDVRRARRHRGDRAAMPGLSPGFRDMRWRAPVHPGDRISYRSTLTAKRPLGSRPWGLIMHNNTGINQDGRLVVEFQGSVFWQKRPVEASSVPLEAHEGSDGHAEIA